MQNRESTGRSPELPTHARIALGWIPLTVQARAISGVLNALFAMPLVEGELEFLAGRVVNVFVADAGLRFSLRLKQNKFSAGPEVAVADLTIEGTIHTFLLLATRKEDADTLFFCRLLKTSGDTELGLYVKNFLDGIEPETLPYQRTIDTILRSSLVVADAIDRFRNR